MARQREASKLCQGSPEAPLEFNARSCSARNAASVQKSKEQSGLASPQQSAKRGAQDEIKKAAAGVGKQP